MLSRGKPLARTALKRGAPMKRRTRLRARSKTNSYRRRARDVWYLLWLRTLDCCACRSIGFGNECGPIEAAHRDVGGKAMSNKTPDADALPLCRGCHRAPGLHRWNAWVAWSKPERRDWWMRQVAEHRAAYETALAKGAD